MNENINKLSNLVNLKNNQEKINLIKNFKDCQSEIEKNNRFWIINEDLYKIYDNNYSIDLQKAQKILSFIYKKENYIFINDGMRILKIIKDGECSKNNYVNLKLIETNDVENVLNDLIKIQEEIEGNYKLSSITGNNNLIKADDKFNKQYYIFSKDWFNEYIKNYKLDKYQKMLNEKKVKDDIFNEIKKNNNKKLNEKVKPKFKLENLFLENLEYPMDFVYIQKDINNEKRIQEIVNYDKRIKLDEFIIYEIFIDIISRKNSEKTDKKQGSENIKYICIITRNKQFIYIYSLKKNNYDIKWIIKIYQKIENDNENLNELIKLFKEKGIDASLAQMGINFEEINTPQKLIDTNIKVLGEIINKKAEEINKKINQKSIGLEPIESEYPFLNPLIQCLVNIKPMMDYFLDRQRLSKDCSGDETKITKEFSALFQNLWYSKDFSPYNFLITISELKTIKNYAKVINSPVREFISFLLETIHYELNGGNGINLDNKLQRKHYNSINELKNDFYDKNNSEIKNIFFFETETIKTCSCSKKQDVYYSINYYLYTSAKNFINDKSINSATLLLASSIKETKSKCEYCNTIKKSKLKFISFPEVLLVIVDDTTLLFSGKNNFISKKEIDLKDFSSKNKEDNKTKYILKSFLFQGEKNDEYISICNSPMNKKWYKYKNNKNNTKEIKDLKNYDTIPNLLVFQKDK